MEYKTKFESNILADAFKSMVTTQEPKNGTTDESPGRFLTGELAMPKHYTDAGKKFDDAKPDMSLLSTVAITKIATVMTFGKKKYNAHNWRKGIVYSRLLAAALRHIFAYLGGETLDAESGQSHLAHASCCLMMLLEFESTRPELDDRYKEGVK